MHVLGNNPAEVTTGATVTDIVVEATCVKTGKRSKGGLSNMGTKELPKFMMFCQRGEVGEVTGGCSCRHSIRLKFQGQSRQKSVPSAWEDVDLVSGSWNEVTLTPGMQ